MSLKAVPIWICANNFPHSQLGVSDLLVHKRCRFVGYSRTECLALSVQRAKIQVEDDKPLTKPAGFNSLSGFDVTQISESVGFHKDSNSLPKPLSVQRAKTPVEDDKSLTKPDLGSLSGIDVTQISESIGFHKDLNSLPKPLSATDLSSSPNDGSKVRVAYQGVPGAYSEAAALKAYPKCETVPCDQFEAAFKAVELWLVDKAVLPIENSVGGSIHRNYDLLLRHRLHIVGEVQLVVNHCLLGLPGVRKEDLKRVLSHPQALDQCEMTLNKLGVVRVNADDTAGAAQIVAAEGIRDTGAVASSRAAEIYGLDILAERMQDESDNITRFLILAREPIIPGTERPYKTSIVFTLEEGPGILFKALAVFALREINLSKIESRPQRKRPLRVVDDSNKGSAKYFDYLFYIDFEASMAEPRAQYALGHLQEFAKFIRVLGCYPMDTIQ